MTQRNGNSSFLEDSPLKSNFHFGGTTKRHLKKDENLIEN